MLELGNILCCTRCLWYGFISVSVLKTSFGMSGILKNCSLKLKRALSFILGRMSREFLFTLIYVKHRGNLPDFKNPRDISEIVLSQILSGKILEYADFVDKLKLRNYLTDWGYGDYLPKIYGVWNSPEEIAFSSLPNSFALKTNHGCGSHYFCRDKSKLDISEAKATISKALRTNFGRLEPQYGLIAPKCYAEEFLDDGKYPLPMDYKFMTCDGTVRCVMCILGRGDPKGIRIATFDKDWNPLDYIRPYERYNGKIDRPENLNEMWAIAEDIAKRFPQVRVDLYSLKNGKIYIGELTFTPEGGFVRYFTNDAVRKLGHLNQNDSCTNSSS